MFPPLRWRTMAVFVGVALIFWWLSWSSAAPDQFRQVSEVEVPLVLASNPRQHNCNPRKDGYLTTGKFHWGCLKPRHPVQSVQQLPAKHLHQSIPKIQGSPKDETPGARAIRLSRLDAVKGNFTHAWKGYKDHAWLHDEVKPRSGGSLDPFGGWAATLVDSLDTLWILGLHDDFKSAVKALDAIDFTTCSLQELNVFETTIRYLGGFLAAYDLSGEQYPELLQKAYDMGEMLYASFDTPNRMPITRWDFKAAASGESQQADPNVLAAEIGSLTLEFTRLSQLTGDHRFFDAVQRIMDVFYTQQLDTTVPGLWPVSVNARKLKFTDYTSFTIGGMEDSLYEYLPKQYMLLNCARSQYREMYERAEAAMKQSIFFRPMVPDNVDILFPGTVSNYGSTPISDLVVQPDVQHLGCFAGGMVAVAAKIFQNDKELSTARKLVEGCLWAYENGPNGIQPEIFSAVPCKKGSPCQWDEAVWKDAVAQALISGEPVEDIIRKQNLPKGVVKVSDKRYILRPEAIESVFILYRITGDETLRERAWKMFNSIIAPTITNIAHAALDDCMAENPPKADRMESFWLAETLKYFYLIFSDSDLVSLDDYVLNTEAHPLRRQSL